MFFRLLASLHRSAAISRQALCSLILLVLSLSWNHKTHAAHQAEPEVIEFWTMSLKPKFIPYFERLVSDYQKQYPQYRIVWVDFPWDILQLKLITAIAAGKPPALVHLSVPWAEEMARDGLLEPVGPWLTAPAQAISYTSGALDDLRFHGQIYGFPHYSNVNVLAYNRKLWQAAGLPEGEQAGPCDMDQLLQMARQIAERTGKPAYGPALGKIDGFMLQQGLPLIAEGRAVFNSPAHVALIKKLALTYRAGGLFKDKLFADDNFPAVVDAYLGGRLALMVSAPTALRRVQTDAPQIYAQTGVFAMPAGPTGLNDGGWLFHFAIPKGNPAANFPAITQFARYLTNASNQLAFARQAGVMPTDLTALSNPYFYGTETVAVRDAATQALQVAARSMQAARSLYVAGIDDYDELRRYLVQAAEAGITGRQDIQLALDQAVRLWNRKLAKLRPHQPAAKSGTLTSKQEAR